MVGATFEQKSVISTSQNEGSALSKKILAVTLSEKLLLGDVSGKKTEI